MPRQRRGAARAHQDGDCTRTGSSPLTPKGELIQLPKGATPVDFAYAVHTDLGDQTVGSKINGRVMPLRTPLDNGDQVEILVSKAQHPQPGLAFLRRHRQGAGEDPALGEIEGARGNGRAGAARFSTRSSSALPAPLGWEAIAEALRPAAPPQ